MKNFFTPALALRQKGLGIFLLFSILLFLSTKSFSLNCNAQFLYLPAPNNLDSIHFKPSPFPSPGTTYVWTFGDGSSSTNQDPWHLYSGPGAYWVCLTVTEANGNTCNWCDSIHVHTPPPPPPCNAHFQFLPSPFNPDSIHFKPSPFPSPGTTYAWTFGDGSSSTNQDPWHLYSGPGAYWVCLTVTEGNGNTCNWCDSIHVHTPPPPPPCNAHFQFLPSPFNPDSIHFKPSPFPSPGTTYAWTFGDGSSSTNQDPWHVYTGPGAYWVCLTVTEGNGNTCTWCDSIHVHNPPPPPPCNAHFQHTFYPNNPDSIHFRPSPFPSPGTTYAWTFGDGSSSTNQDPWHLYTAPGAYWVCLTVTEGNGNTCNWCDSIHVHTTPPPPPCNAHFQHTFYPNNPDSIHFRPSPFPSPGTTYAWTFGDGSSSTNQDPWHVYTGPGAYWVCLTVTEGNGNTCTQCDSIHVHNPPPPPPCNAHFQHFFYPNNPDSIHFKPSPFPSPGTTYAWTFGDGASSTNQDPWHVYTSPGAYWVCLTVTEGNGNTCTQCDSIHVHNLPPPPPCNAHFQHTFYPNNPDSIHFRPSPFPSPGTTYAWTFGDGASSTNQDPWHVYTSPGAYWVCLTVTEGNGNTCTQCDSIHVHNPPPPPPCNAHFQHFFYPNNPDSIHFKPSPFPSPGTTYAWTFGDGASSTNQDPWHVYTSPGAYWVCLTVTEGNGNTCTQCDSIHVHNLPPPPPCNAHFQHTFYPNNPDSIHFRPSPFPSPGTTYAWTFGDGATSTNQDPWHVYTGPGAYWVCLTVTEGNGNTCTWCDSIHVINPPPPPCNAHFIAIPGSNPDSVHYLPFNNFAAQYDWSFGDGSTSNSHDPWHLYNSQGMYFSCLTVIEYNGATCTWCDSVQGMMPHPGPQVDQYRAPVVIFPNPVDASMTVNSQYSSDPLEFEIYNLTGNRVYQAVLPGNSNSTVNTGQFFEGAYYYFVRRGGELISQGRLLIMH